MINGRPRVRAAHWLHRPLYASNPAGLLKATTIAMVDEAIAGLAAANDSPTPPGSATTLAATVAAGSNVTYFAQPVLQA